MGKAATYIFMISGIVLVFHLFGLIDPGSTPNSALINILMHPENIASSALSNQFLIAIASLGTIATIVVGFITKNAELAAMTAFTTYLVSLFWDIVVVFQLLTDIVYSWLDPRIRYT